MGQFTMSTCTSGISTLWYNYRYYFPTFLPAEPARRTKRWPPFTSTAVGTVPRTRPCAPRCRLPGLQVPSQPRPLTWCLPTPPCRTVSPCKKNPQKQDFHSRRPSVILFHRRFCRFWCVSQMWPCTGIPLRLWGETSASPSPTGQSPSNVAVDVSPCF